MSTRVDPSLLEDLKAFGLKDASKCFNCSNCTVTCPLSTPENPFPRKMVRHMQVGLKERILKAPEPWLCYYCGDCSTQCPRGAEPGETMMVARRYLTSLYDWTGFSRMFYISGKFEIMAVAVVAVLTGLGLLMFNTGHPDWLHADLNSVWPSRDVERFDLVLAALLTLLLLGGLWRCIRLVMGDLLFKVPWRLYVGRLRELMVHALTQKRFSQCRDRMQWFVHLMIMTGYATIFLLVVVLLNGLTLESLKFQRGWPEYPLFHPIRLLGYYATFAILYGTTYALIGRLKKSKPVYRNSHSTDWMFLILLQLTALTGIFINFTRLLNWPAMTYGIYIIHLMVAVPMLLLEVPFAKWAHLAYRPLVIYLLGVREQYLAEAEETAAAA